MTHKITILLEWDTCQPDNRQYKQPSQVLLPRLPVAVDVPLEHTYLHNSEAIIQAQIAGENAAAPVLTPKGMRHVVNQLEAQFQPEDEITADDFKGGWDEPSNGDTGNDEDETETGLASSDDEWGDDEETPEKATPSNNWDDADSAFYKTATAEVVDKNDTEGWGEEKSDDFNVDDEWGDD